MNKHRYKLVYNPASIYEYRLYKRMWIFWIEVCRSNHRIKIDEYLRVAGKSEVEYLTTE